MKEIIRKILSPVFRRYELQLDRNRQEIDALYKLLYNQVHDLDNAMPLAAAQTTDAFGFQWESLKEGEAMLSDKRFKDNVISIITEREVLIDKEWFKGKDVIDCGSGGGRWSYGLAKLGANITAVDINESAIEATKEVLAGIDVRQEFVLSPLEQLNAHLPAGKKYDLVWAWGVLHHCGSFNKAFQQVMNCVKDGGFIYVYLYSRETLSYDEDISLFKNRVRYNTLKSWKEKEAFLMEKSKGDRTKLHQNHDLFAPLLNRRLEFDYVKKMLEDNGFTDVVRTVNDTELHVRAVKKTLSPEDKKMVRYADGNNPPWMEQYSK
jgi:2-polyprenyl-3-methyl-5-hydroxy-6-metoxy-1,4-benzoquinol methylase